MIVKADFLDAEATFGRKMEASMQEVRGNLFTDQGGHLWSDDRCNTGFFLSWVLGFFNHRLLQGLCVLFLERRCGDAAMRWEGMRDKSGLELRDASMSSSSHGVR